MAWRYLPNKNADIKSGFPLEKDQTVSAVFGEFIAASYIAGTNTGFRAFGTEIILTEAYLPHTINFIVLLNLVF